ncbi:MAG TPA: ABC transporter substrate-binding protein [Dehalococcoidales bacterium]|nr:ABC transporter substrate-binding protein [Dehalococcoidales bacterium]
MKIKNMAVFMGMILVVLLVLSPVLTACGGSKTTTSTTSTTSTTTTQTTTTATTTAANPANGVIKIGMMTPSTGPVPEKGIPGHDGLTDAIKYINDELNGAEGHPIQADWRDSEYNMQKVGTIVQDFINEGDVLFTTHSSSEMKAAQAVANQQGFPGIAVFASTMNLHPAAHIYSTCPDYGDDWVALAKYYKEHIYKGTGTPTIALHLLQGTVGQGTQDAATAMAASIGVNVVDVESHALTTTSEITTLTTIKSKNPDCLIISSVPAPTAVILKNAKDLGITPGMTVMSTSAGFTAALVDLTKDDPSIANGLYGVSHTVTWDENVPGIAKAKQYCQQYHPADYGNMDYLGTWVACLIIQQALDNAVKAVGYDVLSKGGATAWQAVEQQGIQKLNGVSTQGLQGGTITYTSGDNRLDDYLRMYQVQNSKITPIADWQVAPLIQYTTYGEK